MYILAIMVTAVVFSVTGLGVMNLALLVNLDTQEAVQTTETQLDIESNTNIALWRLNSGDDSLGTYTDGDFSSVYDSTAMTLTITMTTDTDTSGYLLTLEEDYHFQRSIASMNSIQWNSHTIGEEPEHRPRENFEFLPQVDLSYWLSIADTIFSANSRLYHDWDLMEGILIFTGSSPKFDDVDLENTTMVFTVPGVIDFRHSNTIKAAYTDSTIYPALVFTDSTSTITFNDGAHDQDHIEGAIFSLGTITLEKGEFSGPIVGREVIVKKNLDFLDDEYSEYYGWPQGFGNFKSYDWPKQIIKWESF